MATVTPVHVIGGGLAGSEAAWQLARAGVALAAAGQRELALSRHAEAYRLARKLGAVHRLAALSFLWSDDDVLEPERIREKMARV